MFRFLTTRGFFLNLIVLIALCVGLVFGFLQLLSFITKHDSYLSVPNVLNKNTAIAIKDLENKGFEVVVRDSVYVDSMPRGIILKQFPDPNSNVKVNRTIFLTVNRVTLPMVDMPSLVGKSKNYALQILDRSHLTLGDTTFKPDYMQGAVLEQRYNGNLILPGAKLQYGSKIDLVIGSGLSEERVPVPNLIGKTFGEAKIMIESSGILLAGIIPEGPISDTATAFVWKQNPEATTPTIDGGKVINYIRGGQIIDVWISQTMIYPVDTTSTKKGKFDDNNQR